MAERSEIINELEALETHCRAPLMSVEARTAWMRNWCDDLGEFPIDAIRLACRDWRQGTGGKFPTPGQLLPLIRAKIVREHNDGDNKPWEPLSDMAYDALPLRDKIRHLGILRTNALAKGGPMWRNGQPLTAEEMPASWHEQKKLAQRYADEARRLQGKLLIAKQSDVA